MFAIPHMRRLTMMLVMALLMAGAVAGLQVATARPAHALCSSQPLSGNWHNTNPATNALTRVNIQFHCDDTIICEMGGDCTGGESYFILRPYGKCHPTDCDWGGKRSTPMGDGWERAIYHFGFTTSYVWVKAYPRGGTTYLRVRVVNDFTSADGRRDYTTDGWMVK